MKLPIKHYIKNEFGEGYWYFTDEYVELTKDMIKNIIDKNL